MNETSNMREVQKQNVVKIEDILTYLFNVVFLYYIGAYKNC